MFTSATAPPRCSLPLDVKSGMVIGACLPRHRAKEFLRFLRRIDRAVLKPRDVYLVLGSEADQKTVRV